MVMTQNECILTKILDCGSLDLAILEDIQYDLDEIIDDLMFDGCLSFTELIRAVFRKGIDELKKVVNAEIERLREDWEDAEYEDNKCGIELKRQELETLSPDDDIEYFINYLDTHIYFNDADKREIYFSYFADELSDIENNMGFYFK